MQESVSNILSSIFNSWFTFSLDQWNYKTKRSTKLNLIKYYYSKNRYRNYPVITMVVESWKQT